MEFTFGGFISRCAISENEIVLTPLANALMMAAQHENDINAVENNNIWHF